MVKRGLWLTLRVCLGNRGTLSVAHEYIILQEVTHVISYSSTYTVLSY